MLDLVQTLMTNKLRSRGYSDVNVAARLSGQVKWPDLVVNVEAKKGDESINQEFRHCTMSMWSADDVANCFVGLVIKDPFITQEYGGKLTPTEAQ